MRLSKALILPLSLTLASAWGWTDARRSRQYQDIVRELGDDQLSGRAADDINERDLEERASTSTTPTSGTGQAVFGVSTPPSSSSTKYIYAHFIVGNTQAYSESTWADDINQAASAGIDGFALNFGASSFEYTQISSAYSAAESHGGFTLFLSLDMTANPCASTADAASLASIVSQHASSSAQATYQGKTLVGTFSGETCTFGQSSPDAGWNYFRLLLTQNGVSMFLVPAIFVDPSTFGGMSWFDGELNWNGAWPSGASDLTTSGDEQYIQDLGGRAYMPAISPFFFTYYGPDSYNKDFIYRSDDWLLATRMEQVTSLRDKVDFAEIISWNDYGESHYIGPMQPNAGEPFWSNNMDHTDLLQLLQYYIPAFKTGEYATPTNDMIYLWSRPHSKNAVPSAPTLAKPSNWQDTDDNLYAVILLSSPAEVVITSGSNSATWNAPAGLSKFSVPSSPGSISGCIYRGGNEVKSYDSTGQFSYETTPTDYNFNYFVASA